MPTTRQGTSYSSRPRPPTAPRALAREQNEMDASIGTSTNLETSKAVVSANREGHGSVSSLLTALPAEQHADSVDARPDSRRAEDVNDGYIPALDVVPTRSETDVHSRSDTVDHRSHILVETRSHVSVVETRSRANAVETRSRADVVDIAAQPLGSQLATSETSDNDSGLSAHSLCVVEAPDAPSHTTGETSSLGAHSLRVVEAPGTQSWMPVDASSLYSDHHIYNNTSHVSHSYAEALSGSRRTRSVGGKDRYSMSDSDVPSSRDDDGFTSPKSVACARSLLPMAIDTKPRFFQRWFDDLRDAGPPDAGQLYDVHNTVVPELPRDEAIAIVDLLDELTKDLSPEVQALLARRAEKLKGI